ncbi:MAG: GAF domain-containing protein, partial [Candidatus Eisenbacteria bacterium]|nr:GAF domain-containing protein [Candidatus Eisenbacteria bacterium]
MSLQQTILILALIGTLLPVVAVLIRGRAHRVLVLATVLTAAAVALHLFSVLRLVVVGPIAIKTVWVYALVASAVPVLLAGYLFSACFGRECPDDSLRACRRVFFLLGLGGLVFLVVLQRPEFLTGYDWRGGAGTIYLGYVGKAFASYLLVGIVLIGHNFEKTYRLTTSETRPHLRLAYLGFFGVLGFYTFLLATGLLYASVGLGKLVAAGIPIALAGATTAHGYLRGSVVDASTRVSRSVVYSSFTALAAGIFVLAIGVVAQVATLTRWSPDEILIVTVSFVAVLVAVLLLFSNRFQRAVRRYIDRNFYVNRYDYRTQWSRITEFLEGAADRETLIRRLAPFLTETFAADAVTITLRNEATGDFEPVHGKGVDAGVTLGADSPLCEQLAAGRKALLLDRKSDDLSYIPIYAENSGWLDATASQIVAPLLHAGELVGLLGLERRDEDDRFTYEDVSLLDAIAAHVAAMLRSLQLIQELSETRESQLMSQWSRMML